GCVYLVELAERLRLPADVAGAANPKSSTGRIDVFVRLVIDSANGRRVAFDEIPAGYDGPLYAEISPRTVSGTVSVTFMTSSILRGSWLSRARTPAAKLAHLGIAAISARAPLDNHGRSLGALCLGFFRQIVAREFGRLAIFDHQLDQLLLLRLVLMER
ncbi:MAG: 2'-deoxycytidine 5'-triphosphate deaminase, partial [Sphingomonadales bacterium]|nr:2'-deoxycytidine 5'-triphosphate deaminase [Sphingomonadales bacterium]